MYAVGTPVVGYTYTDEGRIRIEGVVMFRTDDPEEMWQDYGIQDKDGRLHYCNEQEVYPNR